MVDEAVSFIARAHEIWRMAPALDKVRFQKLVYRAGIYVNPDKTFGTTQLSPIYQQLTDIEKFLKNNSVEFPSEKSTLVPRAGFEPAALSLEVSCSIQLSYRGASSEPMYRLP